MISIRDAETNQMMRDIALYASQFPRSSAVRTRNSDLIRDGVTMVGDQIALVDDAVGRRTWLDRRGTQAPDGVWDDTTKEHESNELHLSTETAFSDPGWRVEILDQGMQLVEKLIPKIASVAPIPAQIVLAINSGFDENADEGSDATVGVIKFYLMRPGRGVDARIGLENAANPAAVFTVQSRSGR